MPKVIDRMALSKAVLTYNSEIILNALKDEASRMTKEMKEWMVTHEKYDPTGMAAYFEDEGLFDAVKKASRYMGRIYDRNKSVSKLVIDYDVAKIRRDAEVPGSDEYVKQQAEMDRIAEEILPHTDEQVRLAWRIIKVYGFVRAGAVNLVGTGEADFDPFEDYEYDPERS